VVIIWLNGAFGAGKTATATELLKHLPAGRLFDPETVGYMLRPNLADHPVPDFQHWPPWRTLVVATAAELVRYTGQHLIAVQTVLDREYLAEIFAGLSAAGLSVFHVLLDAKEQALRFRIEASDEARQWRLDHLAHYHLARPWLCKEADLVVDTTALTPDQAAREIAGALPWAVERAPQDDAVER
jgi:AAA domain